MHMHCSYIVHFDLVNLLLSEVLLLTQINNYSVLGIHSSFYRYVYIYNLSKL